MFGKGMHFRASLAMPEAETYCCTQPRRRARLRLRGVDRQWPNSPAAPFAPATMRPSEMTAPPTPVPSVMNTTFSLPRPPPFRLHPSPQHSRRSRPQPEAPTVSSSAVRTSNTPQPRFTQRCTTPSAVTGPGCPRPRPKCRLRECCAFLCTFEFPPQYHAAPPCRRPQSRSESPTFSSKVPSSSNKPSFTVSAADVSADDILFVFHFYNSSPRAVSHAFNTRLYKFPFGLNRKLLSNPVYHISPPIARGNYGKLRLCSRLANRGNLWYSLTRNPNGRLPMYRHYAAAVTK